MEPAAERCSGNAYTWKVLLRVKTHIVMKQRNRMAIVFIVSPCWNVSVLRHKGISLAGRKLSNMREASKHFCKWNEY
jgi:hypothetical protein